MDFGFFVVSREENDIYICKCLGFYLNKLFYLKLKYKIDSHINTWVIKITILQYENK